MEISIIIPFHRGKQYLRDCLESLCEQRVKNFETILVLDHPEEELEELLERFSDTAALQILQLDGKSGTAAARNMGLSHAKGEYVCFLDSDDYLLEDTLSQWLAVAKKRQADVTAGTIETTWYKRRSFLEELRKTASQKTEEEKTEDEKPEEKQRKKEQSKEKEKKQQERNDVISHCFEEEPTVLGLLFRREFLTKHHLSFPEQLAVYSDFPFLSGALAQMKIGAMAENGCYIKRFHNDPIQLPSLTQEKRKDRSVQYADSFLLSKEAAKGERSVEKALDKMAADYFIGLYQKTFLPKPGQILSGSQFQTVCQALRQCGEEVRAGYRGKEKKILEGYLSGKEKQCIFYGTLSMGFSKFQKSQTKQTAIYRMIDRFFFQKLPLKENWIVFESYLGKNYADSCKYLYRYLEQQCPGKYKFIWVFREKRKDMEGSAVQVKYLGLKHFYYASRAKYWVNNMRQPIWRKKRKGQIFLETWHGTPLKRLVFDMEDVHSATATYKEDFYQQSRQWDYLLSDNPFSTEVFEKAFLFPREKMLEHGYPRNDILHWENKEAIGKKIREKLKIPKDKKTILYAPTWRDDEYYGPGQYKFKLALDLDQMRKALSKDYVILLRTHYFIADQLDTSAYEGFAYNVSRYDDVSELYLISDICITDYSSVFFDYANLKRPLLFYTYDLEKYRDVLRGFYIDMEKEVPGPLLYTTQEVIEAIEKIDQVEENYRDRYEQFYEKFCCWDDGCASQRIGKDVFGVPYEK